jgi:hypothetical protein
MVFLIWGSFERRKKLGFFPVKKFIVVLI